MSDRKTDPDTQRRALLRAVLAGGAAFALPVVATLAPATGALAAPATGSESEEPHGQPGTPGAPGQGPANRPAEPGAGGRGFNSGINPGQGHDDGGQESQPPGNGAYLDEIGPGRNGFG
ncbi:MAG: hypothetical protein KDK12_07960 [Rhodobacteraceae bacterium]|nr:hypothetical protein [Paracoccaceae bacterium]